ncbi:hypothetical protein SKAU_G00023420 [Synaphobranchus kaupii]|uniref:Uncharacterized protein n=1 Tax=Synaphobranchus kaupii TaxID=118154 RepID=A0A9Q1GDN2_SYNKA|nr:hypothetical protein SKAU_G00023420 [Synaphobranchus kaupii]
MEERRVCARTESTASARPRPLSLSRDTGPQGPSELLLLISLLRTAVPHRCLRLGQPAQLRTELEADRGMPPHTPRLSIASCDAMTGPQLIPSFSFHHGSIEDVITF